MKRVKKSAMFPWMRKCPVCGRLFGLLVLVTFPVYILAPIIVEAWPDITKAWKDAVAVTFLPWEG